MYGRQRWPTGLELVFALDLEDVEEVGGGGVDLDQVLVVFGGWIGQVGDLELIGALCEMYQLESPTHTVVF